MTGQRVIFTACPNGLAANGNFRISVAIAPQLSASPSVTSPTLSLFPDWTDWPSTSITWAVKVNGTPVSATVTSAAPSSALYQALFLGTTPVTDFKYQSYTGCNIVTYPASSLESFFADLYGKLAHDLPRGDGWPSGKSLLSSSSFGQLPVNDAQLTSALEAVLAAYPPSGGPIPLGQLTTTADHAAQAFEFLLGVTPVGQDVSTLPKVEPPSFDFHQAYSLVQRHPALMRLFGFVVDLEIAPLAGLPATVPVSILPRWEPKLGTDLTTDALPATVTDSASWLAASNPAQSAITNGLLRLSDSGAFALYELDVDGATLKGMNFAQAVYNALHVLPAEDTPQNYAVPALRTAGLSLSRVGNASALYTNWKNNDTFSSDLDANSDVTFYAEDITLGYRIDVWSQSQSRWFQLCARTGAQAPLGLGGYGIGKPPTVVPVPAGDEGWMDLATTQQASTSGPSGNPAQYMQESLFRWDGWSLTEPRFGKYVSEDPTSTTLTAPTPNAPPADADFQLEIDYAVAPGTLPRLRFGQTYRVRARAVDAAGNSVPFDTNGALTYASPAVTFGRLEPVPSPAIVPCAPRTAGESLETLVIRSNYDIPDSSPTITPCQRHLAPAVSAVEMLERQGALDGTNGVPKVGDYAMLASRDGLSFLSSTVMQKYGGQFDKQPANAGQSWVYYPPSPGPGQQPFGVPYLPDLLCRGAVLVGVPGVTSGQPLLVPFDSVGAWPSFRALKLVVKAGEGAPKLPPLTDADGSIVMFAPKALIATVRLSSHLDANQLDQMKLWQWLEAAGTVTPAFKKLITTGQHYMFTPYRELTIVHAVRQPVNPPVVHDLSSTRKAGATYTYLNGSFFTHPISTQRVDVLSYYVDPFDDGQSSTGVVAQQHHARVGEFDLAYLQGTKVLVSSLREDFSDTKHHVVYYELLATSRFLEYFGELATIHLKLTTPVALSSKGFVPGTVQVRSADSAATLYQVDTDYVEDDQNGTIARTPTGAIPSGAQVHVEYVAPPVTRSSLEPVAHPPTPNGFKLSIPSSAEPPPPIVRYLMPAFSWQQQQKSPKNKQSMRTGNILRVYLGRPWFESGVGELLGVVVGIPFVGGPGPVRPFITGYGQDPAFTTGAVHTPSATDFTLATSIGENLHLGAEPSYLSVDIAGHEVRWDADRQLWFADIAINAGGPYFPFVKLALVRYQPDSLAGLELSRVVQADFIQLAPDRTATVSMLSGGKVKVEVFGPGYGEAAGSLRAKVRVYIQRAVIKTSDSDLQWETIPTGLAGYLLPMTSQLNYQTTWGKTIKLPPKQHGVKYRLLFAEFERHLIAKVGDLTEKVVYLDAIEY